MMKKVTTIMTKKDMMTMMTTTIMMKKVTTIMTKKDMKVMKATIMVQKIHTFGSTH